MAIFKKISMLLASCVFMMASYSVAEDLGPDDDYGNKGCYEDFPPPNRIFKHSNFEHGDGVFDDNSSKKCIDYCKKQGYKFAGTQYSEECFCGSELKEEDKVDDKECDMPCSGNEDEKCGGSWRMSVYGYDIIPPVIKIISKALEKLKVME